MFQSTPPYKRATYRADLLLPPGGVSIHAPVQAGDTDRMVRGVGAKDVSIHAPVQAGDVFRQLIRSGRTRFNPRPRTSGRQHDESGAAQAWSFNPRPRTSGRRGL